MRTIWHWPMTGAGSIVASILFIHLPIRLIRMINVFIIFYLHIGRPFRFVRLFDFDFREFEFHEKLLIASNQWRARITTATASNSNKQKKMKKIYCRIVAVGLDNLNLDLLTLHWHQFKYLKPEWTGLAGQPSSYFMCSIFHFRICFSFQIE